MVNVSEVIYNKLSEAFKPQSLEIIDDSSKHAGHVGARPSGQTHFTVKISASAFEGMSRIEREKAVSNTLAEERQSHIHALSVQFV